MEEYFLLEGDRIGAYAHMIPEWLFTRTEEGTEVQFWGMSDMGEPCGAAVLSGEDGVLTLQYIYIEKAYRGQGKGQRFFAELLYRAYHSPNRILRVRYVPGEYPKLERLLSGYPFAQGEEEIGSFSCTLGELLGLKYLQGAGNNVKALSECTEESLRPLYQEITEREDDLVELPLNRQAYAADCSAVAMDNGKPAGLLLVREDKPGEMSIPFMVNYSKNITAPVDMIRFAVQTGGKKYSLETICRFAVVSETLLRLLEKMGMTFGKKRQQSTLELSYFDRYEQSAQIAIDEAAGTI